MRSNRLDQTSPKYIFYAIVRSRLLAAAASAEQKLIDAHIKRQMLFLVFMCGSFKWFTALLACVLRMYICLHKDTGKKYCISYCLAYIGT